MGKSFTADQIKKQNAMKRRLSRFQPKEHVKVEMEDFHMSRAKELINFVEEDKASYYSVEYYLEVGEHGGAGEFPTMEQALKKAREIKIDDDTWYVGVITDGSEFAIVHVTQDYIDLMSERDAFADENTKKAWMAAAQKVLQSGKEVIAKW